MKWRVPLFTAVLLFAAAAFAQTDNTIYVRNFAGATVGAKVSAAQVTCGPNTMVPCILVIDPSLAAWATGTMPTLCSHCYLWDFRSGPPSGGVSKILAGMNVGVSPSAGTGVVTINSTGGGGSSQATVNPVAMLVFGDSNTAYSSGTTCTFQGSSTCWPNRIAGILGITPTSSPTSTFANYAVSGDQTCDATAHLFNDYAPSLAAQQPYVARAIGTNDTNVKGAGAYEATFDTCDQAFLSYVTVPSNTKVAASTGTTTGTCASDTTYAGITGEECTASASTLTLSITTTGGPLYIWPRYIDSDAGTWTYAIDGGTAVSVSTALTTAIGTQNGLTTAPGLIRVTGLSSASHTVVFSQTHSGTMAIIGIGTTSTATSPTRPYVFDSNIIDQLNGNDQSAVNAYNTDRAANQALLVGDGLNVFPANANQSVAATTSAGDMANTLHMNAAGGGEFAQAMLAAGKIQPGVPLVNSGWPSSVSSMDQNFSSIPTGTVPASGYFGPGFNVYSNPVGAPGHAFGEALDNSNAAATMGYFQPSGYGGWEWCIYPVGTPLATHSQCTYTYVLPPPTAMNSPIHAAQGSVTNMDGNIYATASVPGSNAFVPGFNFFGSSGHSAGTALSNNGLGYTLDSYEPSNFYGWRNCVYTVGTPLASPTSETCPFVVDQSGDVTAASYIGPSTAPSGSCSTNGRWVFSQDGHATVCLAGTWTVKI